MNSFREIIRQRFSKTRPLPAGTYHYQSPADAPSPYRLHLRLEPDGEGLLIINARTVLHLNQTAAEFAYHLVKGSTEDQTVKEITSRYHSVSKDQARQDYLGLTDRIQTLIHTPDLDPETYLDLERVTPYSKEITAPYRLDCALTYQLSTGMDPKAAPKERVRRDLTTEEWQSILEKAWNAGIPHVIFTGGEPTLRPDLVDLIAHAEKLGQVSGLLTDGLRLSDPAYLHSLLQSGLDHLMIVLEPANEISWEALRDSMSEDIHVTVHLTLTHENVAEAPALLERISQLGVQHLSLSAAAADLADEMKNIRQKAAELGLALVWDVPVPYSQMHPVSLETSEDVPAEGAGKAWLYVEPDGDVLPAQGINRVLGNLLSQPWEEIWKAAR